MEYDEIVDMVVTDLTERSFQQQRTEDEQLDQLVRRRVELSGQVEQITAILDTEMQALLAEYSEVIGESANARASTFTYRAQRTVCGCS